MLSEIRHRASSNALRRLKFGKLPPIGTRNFQKIPAPTLPAAHRIAVVSQWDVKDVGLWLAQLGLPNLQNEFRKHAIDGQELLHLTHETLTNVLGVGRCSFQCH